MNRSIMKFSIVLLIIEILVQESAEQQCNARGLRKVDATFAKLITIGNSGRSFPENKGEDLKKYCESIHKRTRELQNKMHESLPKQIAGVMTYSLKNTMNQLCRKDSKRLTDLISTAPCINKANSEIHKCYSNLIDSLLGAKQANDSQKIPHICCEYYKIFACISSGESRIKICNEFHIKTTLDFIRSILGNVVDLICGDYTEGSDKCQTIGQPPKKAKESEKIQIDYYTGDRSFVIFSRNQIEFT